VVGTGSLDRPSAFTPAGPGRAVIAPTEGDQGTTILIEIATGRRVAAVPRILDCRYDDKATIVCSASATFTDDPELMGIDAGSGQKLWSLPDKASGRVAIDVTAAFHGAVYGTVSKHVAVVLDARTGTDLVPDATVAPTQVVPGYGLLTDGHETSVYPATA
jgi:hypothetical protein